MFHLSDRPTLLDAPPTTTALGIGAPWRRGRQGAGPARSVPSPFLHQVAPAESGQGGQAPESRRSTSLCGAAGKVLSFECASQTQGVTENAFAAGRWFASATTNHRRQGRQIRHVGRRAGTPKRSESCGMAW